MLLTGLAFIVVLGVLIFVHEAGHFLAAKAVGVQVLRFSLGFGQPLIRFRRGETEYWVSWIPLGGYVKMAGMEDEEVTDQLEGGPAAVAVDPERAFDKKRVWQRMIVILAGVTMNVLFAFVVFAGMASVYGTPRPAVTTLDSVATAELPRGVEALATLGQGAHIVRVNGDSARLWMQVGEAILRGPRELRLEIAGRDAPVVVTLPADSAGRREVWSALVPLVPARVGLVLPGLPAYRAGLRPGDLIVRLNGDTVRSWGQLVRRVWQSAGDSLRIAVQRDRRRVDLTAVPIAQTASDTSGGRPRVHGYIGAEPNIPLSFVREPLARAVRAGAVETGERILVVLIFVKELVLGDVSFRDIGGPILIAQLSGQVARLGVYRFLDFLAFFSINLAVLNLLPIPVLDGGHAMFLVAEGIRRKPLSHELRVRLTKIGFAVLLLIIALAISNDLFLRVFRR